MEDTNLLHVPNCAPSIQCVTSVFFQIMDCSDCVCVCDGMPLKRCSIFGRELHTVRSIAWLLFHAHQHTHIQTQAHSKSSIVVFFVNTLVPKWIFWTSSLSDSGAKLKAPFSEKMAGSRQIAPPHFSLRSIV